MDVTLEENGPSAWKVPTCRRGDKRKKKVWGGPYFAVPMLEDLLQISPKPLPDRDPFFSDWKAFLREQNDRAADAWLREAIRLSQGTQGLEELARAEGRDRPRAYLDWFAALIDRSVLAHAHLLAEDWSSAHQLAAQEKVLGWSYSSNAQGLVVPFFLVLLSGKTPGPRPRNLTELWQWGLQNTIRFGFWSDQDREENSPFQRLERIYAEHLSKVSLSRDQQEKLLSWCLDVAKQRASAIVSNQNRNSWCERGEFCTMAM